MVRLTKLALTFAFVASLTIATATPTTGVLYDTTNYAGRPINGFSYDTPQAPRQWNWQTNTYTWGTGTAHGIAYARIGGQLALLDPSHAIGTSHIGKDSYGQFDTKVGYFGQNYCWNGDCIFDHDLAIIWLTPGNQPAALNRIRRGNTLGADYWEITTGMGDYDCGDIYAGVQHGWAYYAGLNNVKQNFTYDIPSNTQYRNGAMTGFESYTSSSKCTLWSNLVRHPAPYRDSGTPWVVQATNGQWTVLGQSSSAPGPNNYLVVTPLKDGMDILDNYFTANYPYTGAAICKDADC